MNINNTEKKIENDEKSGARREKKRENDRYVITDYTVRFCSSTVALAVVFFSVFHRGFCFCRASWNISRQKVHNFVFSDNFPDQKRSFFLSSFSLHLSISTASPCECVKRFNFFFLSSLFSLFLHLLVLLMRLWNDHFFSASCSVSSFHKRLLVFVYHSQCECVCV